MREASSTKFYHDKCEGEQGGRLRFGCLTSQMLTGADPNRQTAAGKATSLHRAAYMGHTHILELLCVA
jgi:hypothetical protein